MGRSPDGGRFFMPRRLRPGGPLCIIFPLRSKGRAVIGMYVRKGRGGNTGRSELVMAEVPEGHGLVGEVNREIEKGS